MGTQSIFECRRIPWRQRICSVVGSAPFVMLGAVGLMVAGSWGGLGSLVGAVHAQNIEPLKISDQWPPPPRTSRAGDVYKVLARHCAGCHQQPIGAGGVAAGNSLFRSGGGPNNILDLERLAKDRQWVEAGLPDASALYNAMVMRHAPSALRRLSERGSSSRRVTDKTTSSISVEELAAVRSWIRWLTPKPLCRAGSAGLAVSVDALRKNVDQYVANVSREDARHLRFVSFAHLAKVCVPFEKIREYRRALSHLFNSLSWEPQRAALIAVDADGLVIAIDLRDLGWTRETWSWLVSQIKSAQMFGEGLADATHAVLNEPVSVLSADAIAQATLSARVYYSLLKVPALANDLRDKLRDLHGKAGPAAVIGINKSEVTGGRRLVARHQFGASDFLWEAVDFGSSRNGALRGARVRAIFEALYGDTHEGSPDDGRDDIALRRFMFRLPNGHPAFMLADAQGVRVAGRNGYDHGSNSGEGFVEAGLTCMGCHGRGLVEFSANAISFGGRSDKGGPSKFPLLTFGDEFLAASVANDFAKYESALPGGNVGKEIRENWVVALRDLAREYEKPLNLRRAAAELDVVRNDLRRLLEGYDGRLVATARQLRGGVVSREKFNQLALSLGYSGGIMAGRYVNVDDTSKRIAAGSQTQDRLNGDGGSQLELWSSKARYRTGEAGVIFAQAPRDCRLVLVAIDRDGIATVLLPNAFDKDNLLTAGEIRSVPKIGAPYRLRFNDAGRELLVGLCLLPDVSSMPGVDHDFDVQQFTVIGKWTDYIGKAFDIENQSYGRGYVPSQFRPRRRRGRSRAQKRPDWLKQDRSRYMIARDAIWISIAQ